MEEDEDILNIVSRWEATGLLDGLPMWEREELAHMYDNSTRLLLSVKALNKIPNKTYEMMTDIVFPVVRRLYRRVGTNVDIESFIGDLLVEVEKNIDELGKPATPEHNPIVSFCVSFADNYSDDITDSNTLSDEEYVNRVDKILNTLRSVLLNKRIVTYVDREEKEWICKLSDKEKSKNITRLSNQKIAMELLNTSLMDTNKGI